jgi:hypothetical protein
VPWAPGDVLDLGTGARWTSNVQITLKRYTHRVSCEYRSGFKLAHWLPISGVDVSEEGAERLRGAAPRGLARDPRPQGRGVAGGRAMSGWHREHPELTGTSADPWMANPSHRRAAQEVTRLQGCPRTSDEVDGDVRRLHAAGRVAPGPAR